MMSIVQKWWSQVINWSHRANSQDCGERGLGMCEDINEKDMSKKLLQEHREAESLERKKVMHHTEKCLKKPKQYMCLMIDGMEQTKTCLPHMRRLPIDINDECLVQMHLVGCLTYNRSVGPHVFITYPNVHNDHNLAPICLLRHVHGAYLPPCAASCCRCAY